MLKWLVLLRCWGGVTPPRKYQDLLLQGGEGDHPVIRKQGDLNSIFSDLIHNSFIHHHLYENNCEGEDNHGDHSHHYPNIVHHDLQVKI